MTPESQEILWMVAGGLAVITFLSGPMGIKLLGFVVELTRRGGDGNGSSPSKTPLRDISEQVKKCGEVHERNTRLLEHHKSMRDQMDATTDRLVEMATKFGATSAELVQVIRAQADSNREVAAALRALEQRFQEAEEDA